MSYLPLKQFQSPRRSASVEANISSLYRFAYRVTRKLSTASDCGLFGISCRNVNGPELPRNLHPVVLSKNEMGQMHLDKRQRPDFGEAIERDDLVGIGILDQHEMLGHVWLHANQVSGEHNHDGVPNTALPLSLPPAALFLSNAYVSPQHRGKRLYASMVRFAASAAVRCGYERIVLTTEIGNAAALTSVRRMGFEFEGVSRFWKIGPFVWAQYPEAIKSRVQFGKYAGDTN